MPDRLKMGAVALCMPGKVVCMKALVPTVYGVLTRFNGLNAYLIEGEDGLTLVDTGIGGFMADVEKALASGGRKIADIRRIFITHAHPDHVGDLPRAQALTNATTYAHRLDAAVIRGEAGMAYPPENELGAFSRFMLARMKGTKLPVARVDRDVSDGDVLDEIQPGATVVHLPGHSYGHSGLLLPQHGVLIGGDVLMRLPWGLVLPLRPASPDWAGVKDSIRKVAGLPFQHLLLGHGAPLLHTAKEAVQAFAARL